jgi:hypothetical protein
MPRKPNGARALTSTERGRLYRERRSHPNVAMLVDTFKRADLQTREQFLLSLGLPPFYADPARTIDSAPETG